MEEVVVKQDCETIVKGPVDGMIIVDGKPQIERVDSSGITIRSVEDLEKLNRMFAKISEERDK